MNDISNTSIKPKILIVSCVDPNREPRLWRQLEFFRYKYDVTVIGTSIPKIDNVNFIEIFKLSKLKKIILAFSLLFDSTNLMPNIFKLSNIKKYDLIICHDLSGLGLGFAVAQKSPIVFDAHEYYPKQREDSLVWRVLFAKPTMFICKKYMPKCAAVVTVGENIKEEYKKDIPLAIFTVVRNAPKYKEMKPSVAKDTIKIIHHGLASKSRNLESMIDMLNFLDSRFTLTLMLMGDGKYYNQLKEKALSTPRVIWKKPVNMNMIVDNCNQYDIGLIIVPPNTYNHLNSLPNKFFECIQARLAIAIGPYPEMAKIVRKHNIGIISKDFSALSMAQSLNKITKEEISIFKMNADKVARIYNAENEMKTYKKILQETLIKGNQ